MFSVAYLLSGHLVSSLRLFPDYERHVPDKGKLNLLLKLVRGTHGPKINDFYLGLLEYQYVL